jgi:predicted lactoylglutathione lyase
MNKQIFLNLPVADLPKSTAFFKALGYSLNPQFTGDGCSCFVMGETITVMLLTHPKFREFTPKAVCDTSKAVEVLISLSCESREEVDTLVAKALAAGGTSYEKPEDFGFMYMHSFVDLDGHGWNLLHMSAQPPAA